jgi:ElaB/YqjD/DUF883 family membrane-anchored ribosome-binding protein
MSQHHEHSNAIDPTSATLKHDEATDKDKAFTPSHTSCHTHLESAMKDQFEQLIHKIKHASEEEWPELQRALVLWTRTKDLLESQSKPIKQTLHHLKEESDEELHALCQTGKRYIAAHPLQSLAIAGGIGLIMGALLNRK